MYPLECESFIQFLVAAWGEGSVEWRNGKARLDFFVQVSKRSGVHYKSSQFRPINENYNYKTDVYKNHFPKFIVPNWEFVP